MASKFKITRGVTAKPVKAVVYGPEGVGKTTFASAWPGAVFIDVEGGSNHYDVARMPRPETWSQLLEIVNACAEFPEIGTVIVDTADAAEALCMRHILFEKKWKSIEDAGYGKGYTYLQEEFGKLLHSLDGCVNAGKNVLIVAHAQIRKFEQPDELGAYDRWELKLQKKDAPLVKEWSDLLLFANYKTDTMKDDSGKYRATGGKRRMMYTSHTAAYDAKNRFGLADELPFEFEPLRACIPAHAEQPARAEQPAQTAPQPVADTTKESANEPAKPEPAKPEPAKPEPAKPAPKEPAKPKEAPKEAAKPKPKRKAKPAAKPEPEPPKAAVMDDGTEAPFEEVTAPEFVELRQLMEGAGVSDAALMDAVGSRKNNPYNEHTPIGDYQPSFVRKVLIGHWDAILKTIAERAEQFSDVPF